MTEYGIVFSLIHSGEFTKPEIELDCFDCIRMPEGIQTVEQLQVAEQLAGKTTAYHRLAEVIGMIRLRMTNQLNAAGPYFVKSDDEFTAKEFGQLIKYWHKAGELDSVLATAKI